MSLVVSIQYSVKIWYTAKSLKNTDVKILIKIQANQLQQYMKKNHTSRSSWIIWGRGVQGFFNICKVINVTHSIKKLRSKNHTIISIDAEKAFDKLQHPFMIKTLQNVGVEGTYLNITKVTYDKHTSNAYFTYMQSTSWEMLGWKKHKLESRLPGEISIISYM